MKLDSRLLERADEDGYQIDHQAVDQRDEYALNAAARYSERYYLVCVIQNQSEKLMGGYECCHDGCYESPESDVPDPSGGLPRCDEYAYQEQGQDAHISGSSIDEEVHYGMPCRDFDLNGLLCGRMSQSIDGLNDCSCVHIYLR